MSKVPFFVTCGRGMDYFVNRELNSLQRIVNVEAVDGKVFFDVVLPGITSESEPLQPSWLQFLFEMKSAERLFVCVYRRKTSFCKTSVVAEELVGDLKSWKEAYFLWTAVVQNSGKDGLATSPVVKRRRQEGNPGEPGFRVSCKCAGEISHTFTKELMIRVLSQELQRQLHWSPELKNPTLEVYVHINDAITVVGFPASKTPLSKRPYLKSIKLRSTVCWAMAQSADIKLGDIVLDPMCGSGTVLIETLKSWKVNSILGIDICPHQLHQTSENCKYASVSNNTDLILGNTKDLPIRDQTVDVILCDFPFGLKHGNLGSVKALLPRALPELNRVCKSDGRIVILISQQLVEYLLECVSSLFPRRKVSSVLVPKKCRDTSAHSVNRVGGEANGERKTWWWKNVVKHYVKLGELHAFICTFHKKLA